MRYTQQHVWGLVLAGGEGTRTREFLSRLCGGRGIKQFCAVIGRRSMLQHTLARVEQLIPRERILVVVSADHQEEVHQQLYDWPAKNIIVQPLNRETAPGILLPLAHISQRDPFATVAIFPSDHCILDEASFMEAVATATSEVRHFVREIILLGTTPTGLDEGYGWMEPGAAEHGRRTRTVCRFWEKPHQQKALELLEHGAVWNTFVCVAQASALWEMTRQAAPELERDFALIRHMLSTPQATFMTERVYHLMAPVNFSSGICQKLPSRLRMLSVPEVGWSDWGSPERICETLQQLGKWDECLRRLQQRNDSTVLSFRPSTSALLASVRL